MNLSTPFVILSAERRELGVSVNAQRSAALFERLTALGVDFQTVDGTYEGRDETAYLVLLPQGDATPVYSTLLELAWHWAQDCVLYVDGARQAYFEDPVTRATTVAGQWVQFDGFGELPDSYTVTPDGRYWRIV